MTQVARDYLETGMGSAPKLLPGSFTPEVNRTNDYKRDRALQRSGHTTGIPGVNNHDRAIVEAMGPIVDRENEHLGSSDVAVIAARRKLIQLAKDLVDGKEPDLPQEPSAFNVRPIDVTTPLSRMEDVVLSYSDKLRFAAE